MNNKKTVYVIISILILVNIALVGLILWQRQDYKQITQSLQQQINILSQQPDQTPIPEDNQVDIEIEEVVPTSSLVLEKTSGFIKKVYDKDGKKYLDIDYIQWLNEEDCKAKNLECNPNGYLILNQNTQIRSFEISPNVDILADIYNHLEDQENINGVNMSYEEFKSIFSVNSNSYSKDSIYWITTDNNIVTSIKEQYQP